jgi:hypothetical protein
MKWRRNGVGVAKCNGEIFSVAASGKAKENQQCRRKARHQQYRKLMSKMALINGVAA